MFKFIKNKINKVYNQFTKKISSIFTSNKLDAKFLQELKVLLLSADTGVKTTNKIIETLQQKISNKTINNMEEAKAELEKILIGILNTHILDSCEQKVIMLVGINGTGKTTFAAKLANKLKLANNKVLLVAADTFRAAAVEQLQVWGERIGVEVFTGKTESRGTSRVAGLPVVSRDPASVVFNAVTKFKNENYDYIIIDTAGRMQTKTNLMRELEKINKVIGKILGEQKITIYLTIDAMIGQNSFEQARVFKEATNVDGIVLTKLDGTGKGGIVFAITQELGLPISYITFGESIEDIKDFGAKDFGAKNFVRDLLSD